ncbi:Multiple epidermal growth factor-like domains protein 8 [Entomortierella beljakovae]|nr:Multiple epidermal growth factor-like domains protein 8 [Entomortierella beljakovae]
MYLPDSWIDTKGSVGARPTDQYGHRKITLSLRGSFLSIVFILYYILNLTQFSNAQSPTYVSHMAYAFIDGKALYIQGGHTNEANSSQIFALDLSKMDWSTDNPPWIELNAGSGAQLSPVDYEHSMTIAPDQQGLVIWGFNSGISKYNLMTNAWNITLISQPDPAFPSMGTESVANPRTGLIYKLGPTKSGQAIIAFNPNSNAATTNLVPSFLYGELRYHSLTWSTSRSSALLYGGYFVPSERFNTDFLEYRPDADTWSFLTTSGTGPGPLVSHCMVPAYNGSKMIVFGGQGTDRSPLGSIYVLDIPSMTWSKGVDVKSNLYRNNMACAVSGNYFVAVGG